MAALLSVKCGTLYYRIGFAGPVGDEKGIRGQGSEASA
jgi:hypothetical protein